jgi:hypothetical protein
MKTENKPELVCQIDRKHSGSEHPYSTASRHMRQPEIEVALQRDKSEEAVFDYSLVTQMSLVQGRDTFGQSDKAFFGKNR